MAGAAEAGSVAENFCGHQTPLSAAQQDRLLQLAAVVRAELDAAGTPVALIARSGLNLARFGQRFSHAGLALAEGAGSPWAVRQLYYACEEGRPRLFDQGLAGFVSGLDDPAAGHVSLLLLPPEPAALLAAAAQDRPRALRLVAATYSANAHAWSLLYQNCNQWLAELMAAGFVPWLRLDDRPEDQRYSLVFQVSLPASLEAFVLQRWPQSQRLAFCLGAEHIVMRRGGAPLPDDCRPGPGDRVWAL